MTHTHHTALDRRRLLRTAAWTAPAVAAASASPAFAASGDVWTIQRSFTAEHVRDVGIHTLSLGVLAYFLDGSLPATGPQSFHYFVTSRGVPATTGHIHLTLGAANSAIGPSQGLEFFSAEDSTSLGRSLSLPIVGGTVKVPPFEYSGVADGMVVLTASFTPPSGTCEPDRLVLNLRP